MQIKPRPNGRVHLLRTEYDKTTRRTRQRSIGSFDDNKVNEISELPTSITMALSSDESEQLSQWLSVRVFAKTFRATQDRINNASEAINAIAETLEMSELVTAEQLKAVLKSALRLIRAINAQGVTQKDLVTDNIDDLIAAIRIGAPDAERNRLRALCEVISRAADPSKQSRHIQRAHDLIAKLHRSGQLPVSVTLDDFLDSVGGG
jgi:hypothetical protein